MSPRITARRVLPVVLGSALICSVAAADTIYLRNGQAIHTSSARIDGDRVVFVQFGQTVGIPLSEVDRIEENDRTGPTARRPPSSTVPADSTPDPAAASATGGTEAATAGDDEPEAPDPRETKEYWQERVLSIESERQTLELELQDLRRIERAFLFSHRSTAATRIQIEEVQARIEANEEALPLLRREARALGIPPGWLRLPRGGRP